MSQYGDVWSSNAQTIIFRYAEVLLTYVEAENELNGPSAEIYDMLDQIRTRVGMPKVDQSKYGTKETLREFVVPIFFVGKMQGARWLLKRY